MATSSSIDHAFRIENDTLTVTLFRGQTMLVKSGCISVMSGSLAVNSKVHEECKHVEEDDDAEPLYISEVSLPASASKGTAHFTVGAPIPGTVVQIPLSRGDRWIIRDTSFLAATPNLKIEHRFNLSEEVADEVDDEVVPLTRVSVREGASGSLFVHAFGKAHRHDVQDGDSILVNGGLFLAAPEQAHNKYKVQPAGSLFTSTAGVSWVLLKFFGPMAVFTQSHNIESFAAEVEYAQGNGEDYTSDSSSEDDEDEDEEEEDDGEEDEDEEEEEDAEDDEEDEEDDDLEEGA